MCRGPKQGEATGRDRTRKSGVAPFSLYRCRKSSSSEMVTLRRTMELESCDEAKTRRVEGEGDPDQPRDDLGGARGSCGHAGNLADLLRHRRTRTSLEPTSPPPRRLDGLIHGSRDSVWVECWARFARLRGRAECLLVYSFRKARSHCTAATLLALLSGQASGSHCVPPCVCTVRWGSSPSAM